MNLLKVLPQPCFDDSNYHIIEIANCPVSVDSLAKKCEYSVFQL